MFDNASILVTGGTGSWGKEFIRQILTQNPKKVIVFSRNENNQVQMKRELEDNRLHYFIGDIRDKEAVTQACEQIDYVFHLAALKHVPICEEQPLEALKTNVIGTQNVIEAAIAKKVKKVINVSTDKAADPSNFYGMTKALGEKLIIHANHLNSATKFICVRGGNVLGTNGSVVHLFLDKINDNKPITITDKRMTRFFLSKQNAVKLLLNAAIDGKGGETFVMKMPTCRILDLAEVLNESFGKELDIVECGIRPGEKLHEILLSENESLDSFILNDDYLVILPTIDILGLKDFYSTCDRVKEQSYSSKDDLITKDEIKKMLIDGGLL